MSGGTEIREPKALRQSVGWSLRQVRNAIRIQGVRDRAGIVLFCGRRRFGTFRDHEAIWEFLDQSGLRAVAEATLEAERVPRGEVGGRFSERSPFLTP